MKKFKFLFTAMMATLMLAACGEKPAADSTEPASQPEVSQPVSGEPAPSSAAGIVLPDYDDAWSVAIVKDEHVDTVTVYQEETFTTPVAPADFYKTRAKTGEPSKAEGCQFYFKVTFKDGWHAGVISATEGTYNKVKTPGDIKIDDAYALTKVTGNTIINITSSDERVGFKVTLAKVEHATVTFYKDQGYSIVDDDKQIQTRNCKLAPYYYCNDGADSQVCFKVVPENGYEVYEVTAVGVTNPDATAYKNIKDPEDVGTDAGVEMPNCWRITKITQDIKITIDVRAVNA